MRENAIPNKVLVINDENQLYRQMFDDLWDMNCVEKSRVQRWCRYDNV